MRSLCVSARSIASKPIYRPQFRPLVLPVLVKRPYAMGHSVPPVSVPALDWKYCDKEQKREQEKSYI